SVAGAKPVDKNQDYRPYPSTWFNQGHYFDDPLEWNMRNGNGGENADLPDRGPAATMAVSAQVIARGEHQSAFGENGHLPTSEDESERPDSHSGDVHGLFEEPRSE